MQGFWFFGQELNCFVFNYLLIAARSRPATQGIGRRCGKFGLFLAFLFLYILFFKFSYKYWFHAVSQTCLLVSVNSRGSLMYSGAKKVLVSHQVCHLNRWECVCVSFSSDFRCLLMNTTASKLSPKWSRLFFSYTFIYFSKLAQIVYFCEAHFTKTSQCFCWILSSKMRMSSQPDHRPNNPIWMALKCVTLLNQMFFCFKLKHWQTRTLSLVPVCCRRSHSSTRVVRKDKLFQSESLKNQLKFDHRC